ILWKFAIPPAADALRKRRERIRDEFERLERDRLAAAKGKEDEEARLRALEGGVAARLKQATDEADKLRDVLTKEGEEAAARVAVKAKLEAETEHQKMLLELRNEVLGAS